MVLSRIGFVSGTRRAPAKAGAHGQRSFGSEEDGGSSPGSLVRSSYIPSGGFYVVR